MSPRRILAAAAARLRAARPFHEIIGLSLEQPPFFEHPCGPDVYRGRLLLERADAFCFDWRVSGPRKLGRIVSKYVRETT